MAAPGQLTQLLQAAQSADAGVRTQAEQQLAALQAQNFSELLVSLSAELADGSKPVDARRLAGLILKNSLDAKEAARKASARPAWCWGGRWPRSGPDRGGGCSQQAAPRRRRHPPPLFDRCRAAPHPAAGSAGAAVGGAGCGRQEAGQAQPAGHARHAGGGKRGRAPAARAGAQPPTTAAAALRRDCMHGSRCAPAIAHAVPPLSQRNGNGSPQACRAMPPHDSDSSSCLPCRACATHHIGRAMRGTPRRW